MTLKKFLFVILFIILIACLLLAVYLIYDSYFKPKFLQISKSSNFKYFVIPVINSSLDEDKWNNFVFNKYPLHYLTNHPYTFSVDKQGGHIIFSNSPGFYEIKFCISGFKHISNLEDDGYYDTNIIDTSIDYTIEWSIYDVTYQKEITIIPAYSNNRTMGPENVNSFSKIVEITSVPTILGIRYRSLEESSIIITDYRVNNFNFSVKKI